MTKIENWKKEIRWGFRQDENFKNIKAKKEIKCTNIAKGTTDPRIEFSLQKLLV